MQNFVQYLAHIILGIGMRVYHLSRHAKVRQNHQWSLCVHYLQSVVPSSSKTCSQWCPIPTWCYRDNVSTSIQSVLARQSDCFHNKHSKRRYIVGTGMFFCYKSAFSSCSIISYGDVPRDFWNSKQETLQVLKRLVSTLEQMNVSNGTGPGVLHLGTNIWRRKSHFCSLKKFYFLNENVSNWTNLT